MSAFADIVRGRVIDAETSEGVPFASLEWLAYGDGSLKLTADSLGRFRFFAPSNGFLIVSMLGYENVGKEVSVFSESRRDTVEVGDIKLKPTEMLMKMLEVNARARQFTMSGDTIVFHPEAFHLEEGARLEELIRKLPGVTLNENGLSWNGRPLRIIMNGHDLFGGNAIIGQLPAEAVENIKAYNKASEFRGRTGKDDGGEDMVLDLNVKPGFLDRFYGDVKAIYQTPAQYEGEVVANRLSDDNPLMLYADANNRNLTAMHTMQFNWGRVGHEGFGQGQYGSFGYQHNWGGQQDGHTLRSFATISGSIDHNDHWGTRHKDTRNYFPGEVSNRLVNSDHYRNHALTPHLEGALSWQKDSRNTFSLNFNTTYGRRRDSQDNQTEQTILSLSPNSMPVGEWNDSVMMRSQTTGLTTGESFNTDIDAGWKYYLPEGKGSVELTARWMLKANNNTGQTTQDVTYPGLVPSAGLPARSGGVPSFFWDGAERSSRSASAGMDYSLQQDFQSHTNTNSTSVSAEVKRWLTDRVLLTGKYTLATVSNHNDQDVTTNLMPNADETYDDRLRSTTHTVLFQSTINLRPFQLIPNLQYTYIHERENYQRGLLDTLARRHAQRVEPSFQAKWVMKGGAELRLNYRMSTNEPQLLQTIAFRDATNPLFVTTGNPDLRNRHSQNVTLSYETLVTAKQLMIQAWATFTATDREHRTFLQYDPTNGSYLSRLENARGSRAINLAAVYHQSPGVLFWNDTGDFSFQKSYAPLMQTFPSDVRTENCQRQTFWKNNLTIGADWEWISVEASAEVSANHLVNSAADVQNTTLWNNKFTIGGGLRKGKFTVKTDLTEQMRRGYLTKGMNTDHFIWNASVSWRCMHGKGKLELEVNDILNNADNFTTTETANQQVASWSEYIHHYAALSFSYHLDPKQKKVTKRR